MKFKTPCFVRVRERAKRYELIKWLEATGRCSEIWDEGDEYWCALANDTPEHNFTSLPARQFELSHYYDCGTDIELFKALAAMNDENDREQWFVCIKQPAIWRFCLPTVGDMVPHNTANAQFIDCENFRKATAEEIVEHFKNR